DTAYLASFFDATTRILGLFYIGDDLQSIFLTHSSSSSLLHRASTFFWRISRAVCSARALSLRRRSRLRILFSSSNATISGSFLGRPRLFFPSASESASCFHSAI